MSSTENNVAAAAVSDEKSGGMPEADVNFLISCLKNANSGSITVDCAKVAEELGYKNPRSVQNKVAALKKKYDLPLGGSASRGETPAKASTTKSRKASNAGGSNEPAIPATPSKQRVMKTRTPSTKKKAGTKNADKKSKSEKLVKAEYDEEADADNEDADVEDSDTGATIHVDFDAGSIMAASDGEADHGEV